MKKIELSTIIGIGLSLFLVGFAINISGKISDFFDKPSVIIVLVGTTLITIACFSLEEVGSSFGSILRLSTTVPPKANNTAMLIMQIAEAAYKTSLLEMERVGELKVPSKVFERGLYLVMDGENIENVDRIMTHEVMSAQEGYNIMISILRKAGEVAPSMGLIGTLIGLVQMLGSLNDVKSIGPAMAVALLTTFYGAILSYMILFPLSSKLERNARDELLNSTLYLKGLVSISKKENPRKLESILNSILPPEKRIIYFKS